MYVSSIYLKLVMGQTPFYRTASELEHHFMNIKNTWTCSSIGDRTQTPYFWLRTIEHRTSNIIGLSLCLLNYSSNWLEHHFFEHRTNSNVFICWWSNSNTLFLASNDRTSNFEPNSAFTTLTKSLIELTRTSFFRTSNELERVHLSVIELEHPILCFERLNIELRT